MAYSTKASKHPKVVEIANKILDILDITLQPIHDEAVAKKFLDPMKLKNVDYVVGILKTVAAITDENSNGLGDLSDEELFKLLAQANKATEIKEIED